MLVACGLLASVVLPQHAVLLTGTSALLSVVRRARRGRASDRRRRLLPASAANDHEGKDDDQDDGHGDGDDNAATAESQQLQRQARPPSRPRRRAPSTNAAPSSTQQHVELAWTDVSLSVDGGATPVLRGVAGRAAPGRVTAVAGPSGSGKTSLLTVLAGRVPRAKKNSVSLRGRVTVNGIDADRAPGLWENAFIPQEDLFFSELTVRETLELAATMRLPRAMPAQEKRAFVTDLINTLGLTACQNTRVGDPKTRGISGGERKRLSVGCELISSPRIIFADEPTSGLDSFQAEKVMASLKGLAAAGHTVIVSIHQPSGAILNMCDDLVLLARGQVVYCGPTADSVSYFKSIGFPVPPNTNPAEHYLELMSIDTGSPDSLESSQARLYNLVKLFSKSAASRAVADALEAKSHDAQDAELDTTASSPRKRRPVLGPFQQVRVLLLRAFRQITRDKKTNISRFMSSLMSALLFGSIYWRIGYTQSTIQDRLGLLQVCCINAAMSALVKTLQVFCKEREIVNRERSRGAYDILPYFTSKLCAELPISAFFPVMFSCVLYPMVHLSGGMKRVATFLGLITLESFTSASYGLLVGSLAPTQEAAVAIGPASFVIFIVFGGLYIAESNVPSWLGWVPRVSIIKHAFEGLCVNEFTGLKFETKRPWDVRTGEQQLQRLSWSESSIARTCVAQLRVLAFNYLATYIVLSSKTPKFQPLENSKPVLTDVTELEEDELTPVGAPSSGSAAILPNGAAAALN